jgi:hypothetical protein
VGFGVEIGVAAGVSTGVGAGVTVIVGSGVGEISISLFTTSLEQEQSNKAKEIIKAIFFITLPLYHYLLDIYFNFIKNINHHSIYTQFFDFKTRRNI